MTENLPEEFKSLTYKQIRFLQLFVKSEDKEPDCLSLLSEAGYKVDNRTSAMKTARNLLARFANNNKLNFQALLNHTVTDIDLVRKLSHMLDCGDRRTELAALKLITELKGYDQEQVDANGSTIVIEIVNSSDDSDDNKGEVIEIPTNVIPIKSNS